MYCTSFIHSSISGHVGGFYFLAVVNNAERNVGVVMSVSESDFTSLGRIPRNGIAGLQGKFYFHFLKELL